LYLHTEQSTLVWQTSVSNTQIQTGNKFTKNTTRKFKSAANSIFSISKSPATHLHRRTVCTADIIHTFNFLMSFSMARMRLNLRKSCIKDLSLYMTAGIYTVWHQLIKCCQSLT